MRGSIIVLSFLLAAGCASTAASNSASNQTVQAPTASAKSAFTQTKVQQWFSTETPETLPPDKIKKLSLGVGGFGGAY
jgi:hypothetical protein